METPSSSSPAPAMIAAAELYCTAGFCARESVIVVLELARLGPSLWGEGENRKKAQVEGKRRKGKEEKRDRSVRWRTRGSSPRLDLFL